MSKNKNDLGGSNNLGKLEKRVLKMPFGKKINVFFCCYRC